MKLFFFWSVPRYWATPNLSYHCFGATWQVHERGWFGTCICCFNLLVVFVWNCMVWVVIVIKIYSKSVIAEVLAWGRTGKFWENPVSSVVAVCSAGMRRKWKFFVAYYCVECHAEWQRRLLVSQPGKYIFRVTRCRYPYAGFTRKWVLKTYDVDALARLWIVPSSSYDMTSSVGSDLRVTILELRMKYLNMHLWLELFFYLPNWGERFDWVI
jgi:hypothetical protein